MRIPNYLYLAPSRAWHFRQRIPSDLAKQTGQTAIKRSLGTRDILTAQCRALSLARQYADLLEAIGKLDWKLDLKTLPGLLR